MASHYKKSTATVAFFFGLYILNGIAITPCQARTTESIQLSNGGSASLQQTEQ
ncbi:hypothetical protein CITFRE_19260 [Citrobacter freundii]|nr:hypothetical protein [Sedimentibacter saalensis]GCB39791.1 hypothetical protein CITFRE_19260 [Citrobacter freundii]